MLHAYKGRGDAKVSLGRVAEAKANFRKALALIDLELADFELRDLEIEEINNSRFVNISRRNRMNRMRDIRNRIRKRSKVLKAEIEQVLQELENAE